MPCRAFSKLSKNLQSKTLSLHEFEVRFHGPFHSPVTLFQYLTLALIALALALISIFWVMSNDSPSSLLSVCFSKKTLALLSRHKSACSSKIYAKGVITNWAKTIYVHCLDWKNLRYWRVLLGSLTGVVRSPVFYVLWSDIDSRCVFSVLCSGVDGNKRERERYLQILLLSSDKMWRLKDQWCLNTTPFYANFLVFNDLAINASLLRLHKNKSIFEKDWSSSSL